MKRFLKFLAILVTAYIPVVYAVPPLARLATPEDLRKPPLTAVAVTQCNLLAALFATLESGELVVIHKAHVGLIAPNAALAWGNTAIRGAQRIELECPNPAIAI